MLGPKNQRLQHFPGGQPITRVNVGSAPNLRVFDYRLISLRGRLGLAWLGRMLMHLG